MRAVSAKRRRIDMDVTLFPLPDSPTIPKISPLCTEKLNAPHSLDFAVTGHKGGF